MKLLTEEQILEGLNPEQIEVVISYGQPILTIASAGSGKCCHENTRIHTNKGYLRLKELADFVEIPKNELKEGNFYEFKEEVLVRDRQVSDKFYYNGFVDTINLKSKRFEFEATNIHPIRILDKELGVIWKELQHVSVGDLVCVDAQVEILFNNETPKPSWLKHLTEREYGWFVGFFMGDGCIGYNKDGKPNQVSFSKQEQILNYIKEELVPNVNWIKFNDGRCENTYSISLNFIQLVSELVNLGICGTSGIKKLPNWVYSSNKEFLIGLLSGYIDSDGYHGDLEICSKSEELIKGMRDIFNLFGLFPILSDKINKQEEDRLYYKLSFSFIDNEKLKILDLKVDYKKESLNKILEKDNWNNNNQKVLYTVPYKDELNSIYENDIKINIPYSERGKEIAFIKECKRDRRKYFTKYSWNNLKPLLQEKSIQNSQIEYDLNNYEFIEVEEITHGKAETFDISVPTTNTYTANSIVSHNTSSLTKKICYLNRIHGIDIDRILAMTFTNKAAGEMKDRVVKYLGLKDNPMWISTFHSLCVKVLLNNCTLLGYKKPFVIYEGADSTYVIKNIVETYADENMLNRDIYSDNNMKSAISNIKLSTDFSVGLNRLQEKYRGNHLENIFEMYQKTLKENNAMDFDDLLVNSVRILKEYPEILEVWQNKFDYIMADEYQDTNGIQFELMKMIIGERNKNNLMVVGDPMQSIYGFRGTRAENILEFDKEFDNTKIIKLEKNYRSTPNILNFANNIVNQSQVTWKDKLVTLKPTKQAGQNVFINQLTSDDNEVQTIVNQIQMLTRQGHRYGDIAILMRMSFISRLIEENMIRYRIPYQIIGGLTFYERAEIKTLLSYIKFAINSNDKVSLDKILNTPARSIGKQAMEAIRNHYTGDWLEAVKLASKTFRGQGTQNALKFVNLIESLKDVDQFPHRALQKIINEISYFEYLQNKYPENYDDRISNVHELLNLLQKLENNNATFSEFLTDYVLKSDQDDVNDNNRVKIMTIHASKGLEFPVVFIPAMEDGFLPSFRAKTVSEIEEERRLFYVAVTRAEKLCFISHTRLRGFMRDGNKQKKTISPFLLNLNSK